MLIHPIPDNLKPFGSFIKYFRKKLRGDFSGNSVKVPDFKEFSSA